MFNNWQHMRNLEKSFRIHSSCVPSGNWGELDCYARLWEIEHGVSGGWRKPGYLHYYAKDNGIRSANSRIF